jgi:hypothetical protein
MVIIVTTCSKCQHTLLYSYFVLYLVTTECIYMIRVLNVRYFSKQN